MNELLSLCFLCQLPLKSPLKTSCQHVFCQKCILNWLSQNLTCPCNCGILFTNELTNVQNLNTISENLHCRCPNYKNGCPMILMRKEIKSHIKNNCKFPRNISLNSQTPTSTEQNPIDKMTFFNNFIENFLSKFQISSLIQPQIDVINEILNLLVFIEKIKVSQIKFLDIMSELSKKDLKKEMKDIKENLFRIDLKPINSHLLLISDKINVYVENTKLASHKNKKLAPTKFFPQNPNCMDSKSVKQEKKNMQAGFLTSERENAFSKTSNEIIKPILSQKGEQRSSSKKKLKKFEKKDESFEGAKKRLFFQQNRLQKITNSKNENDPPKYINKNIDNMESKHYLLNNFSKRNTSKRSSASIKNSNSIRKTFIDLTLKKNLESPNSQKSKKKERTSNRFKRSNCSIKNTTSSSSGSNKVEFCDEIF